MNNLPFKHYVFGSKNSHDIDVLIEFPGIDGSDKDLQLIDQIKEKYSFIQSWNINLIEIQDGIIVKTIDSKGYPDSVNNSLYETYHLHKQSHPFPLKRTVERNVNLAIQKCILSIFLFFKNTNLDSFYNQIPKQVKKDESLILERIKWLERIDFRKVPFDDHNMNIEKYKKIAFHIGQTISLMDNIEIYTKSDLVYYHHDLSSLIKRERDINLESAHAKLLEFIRKIKDHYNL